MRCEACDKETDNDRFCSRSCSAKVTNREHPRRVRRPRGDTVTCLACGAELNRLYVTRKYCNSTCQALYSNREKVRQWLAGERRAYKGDGRIVGWAREYLFTIRGEKCEKCGWCEPHPISKRPPLQIDHKDGNRLNDRPENLEILCPNCHALTITWGYFGRGNREYGEAPVTVDAEITADGVVS